MALLNGGEATASVASSRDLAFERPESRRIHAEVSGRQFRRSAPSPHHQDWSDMAGSSDSGVVRGPSEVTSPRAIQVEGESASALSPQVPQGGSSRSIELVLR